MPPGSQGPPALPAMLKVGLGFSPILPWPLLQGHLSQVTKAGALGGTFNFFHLFIFSVSFIQSFSSINIYWAFCVRP